MLLVYIVNLCCTVIISLVFPCTYIFLREILYSYCITNIMGDNVPRLMIVSCEFKKKLVL